MATISSHVLDSLTGTHASGIRVECFKRDDSGHIMLIFDREADAQGRISEPVALDAEKTESQYELVFHSEEYFHTQSVFLDTDQIMKVVVIRLSLNNDSSSHHVPLMLSPHSYSVWWSDPTRNSV